MLSKIGTGELIVIILVAFFVVGPEQLPKLARSFGKAVANFKQSMNGLTEELCESNSELKEVTDELKKVKNDIGETISSTGDLMEGKKKTPEKPADEAAETEAPDKQKEDSNRTA